MRIRLITQWVLGALLAAAPAGMARRALPILPDPRLTPGATLPVTRADICVPGYTQKIRDVPESVKEQVYKEYGITRHGPGQFEVDHLISLELGGSNSIHNLWPESYTTRRWNAHVKDALENRLHQLVCSGQLDLRTAQHDIATDWIAAYQKYMKYPSTTSSRTTSSRTHRSASTTHRASPTHTRQPAARTSILGRLLHSLSPASALRKVWVNTRSGKYFLPGSRYYGNTKEGMYMSEAAALRKGYKAAQ